MTEESTESGFSEAEEIEKAERERRIEEIKKSAIKNMQRKISADCLHPGWKKLKKYSETIVTRNSRKISIPELGRKQEPVGKRERSKSMFHEASTSLQKDNRKISCEEKFLKLPVINVEGRARSTTVGCVTDELRERTSQNLDFETNSKGKNDNNTVSILKHEEDITSQTDCGQEVEKLGLVTVDTQSSEGEIGLNIEKGESNGLCQGRLNFLHLGPSLGKKRTPPPHIQFADESLPVIDTITDQSLPSIENKVKMFMKKSLPDAPPQSLKISREHYEKNMHRRRKRQEHLPKIKDHRDYMNLFTANLYLNPFVKTDGKSWNYTDKYGKCRYLRVPPTPVLSNEEIFRKDDGDEITQEPIQ